MVDPNKAAFQEEAREILLELESALLELNEHRDDKELVGRAFRALHAIKGSSSMFGFENVAAFTHLVENAFDEVRNGRLGATSDLISITLAAVDQIRAMLEDAAGQNPADPGAAAQILGDLISQRGTPEKLLSHGNELKN